jgi:glutamyl-tRNA synthetase
LRGDDHINNTPRQINILRALDATPPLYAHVPMILGSDGKRLSKRHGAVSVMQYREDGFLPEALLNYLARLGWSHGDQEIFSLQELISLFEITGINRAPAAFNLDKLLWLNQHYIKTSDPVHVAKELAWHMQKQGIDTTRGPKLTDIIAAQCERTKTLKEMAERSRYFYEEVSLSDDMKAHLTPEVRAALATVRKGFAEAVAWSKEAIHAIISAAADAAELKMGKVAQPLRIVMTGGTVSPPIDLTIELIGRDRAINRLDQVLEAC